jgi:hypothetical protein
MPIIIRNENHQYFLLTLIRGGVRVLNNLKKKLLKNHGKKKKQTKD